MWHLQWDPLGVQLAASSDACQVLAHVLLDLDRLQTSCLRHPSSISQVHLKSRIIRIAVMSLFKWVMFFSCGYHQDHWFASIINLCLR